ncbi:hypothetical protein [Erwinia phage Snitter]|nr:hypothetical protein [Erwinia phage Snitter]
MIELNKLKEIRKSLLIWQDARETTQEKEKYDMFGKVLDVIDQLEVAQQRITELEANHRKHAARLISDRVVLRERAETAEAELARRDAAAGEPFAYHYHYACVETSEGFQDWRYELSRECPPEWMVETGKIKDVKELFTAAQPSALPPEIVRNIDGLGFYKGQLIFAGDAGWYNRAIADAKALGCKAIKLPEFDGYKPHVVKELQAAFIQAVTKQGLTVEGD